MKKEIMFPVSWARLLKKVYEKDAREIALDLKATYKDLSINELGYSLMDPDVFPDLSEAEFDEILAEVGAAGANYPGETHDDPLVNTGRNYLKMSGKGVLSVKLGNKDFSAMSIKFKVSKDTPDMSYLFAVPGEDSSFYSYVNNDSLMTSFTSVTSYLSDYYDTWISFFIQKTRQSHMYACKYYINGRSAYGSSVRYPFFDVDSLIVGAMLRGSKVINGMVGTFAELAFWTDQDNGQHLNGGQIERIAMNETTLQSPHLHSAWVFNQSSGNVVKDIKNGWTAEIMGEASWELDS